MRTKKMSVLCMSIGCITLLTMLSVASAGRMVADYYSIGGAIYTDLTDPIASGEPDVTVTVSGINGTYTGTSSGAMGIWQIDDVPEGTYTVTPSKTDMGFQHLVNGTPDGQSSVTITVNAANMAANQSIQFLAGDPVEYSLDVSVIGGHGSVSANPDSSTYPANTQVSLTATPEDGYRVATWDGIDDGSAAQDLSKAMVTMTVDKTVTVEFEEIPPDMYTLTVEQPENGSISVSPEAVSGVYAEGTVVTLTASPDAGYQVKAWSGTDNDPSVGCATNTVTITEDITVTVEFEVAFSIGGAIYTDSNSPLTSGLPDVKVTVSGAGETYSTTTSGSQGIWQISNLPEGDYTVAPSATAHTFEHIVDGVLDGQSATTISVNSENEAENQSIQFFAQHRIDGLTVNSMTVIAWPFRSNSSQIKDTFILSGKIDNEILPIIRSQEEALIKDITLSSTYTNELGSYGLDTQILDPEKIIYIPGVFLYYLDPSQISQGGIYYFMLNLNQGTFSMYAYNADLSGLRSPVTVEVQIGDYLCMGEANNPLPMALLKGYVDVLHVDTARVVDSLVSNADLLLLQGKITMDEAYPVVLTGETMEVTLGEQKFNLPIEKFWNLTNNIYMFTSKIAESGRAIVYFDFNTCYFRIILYQTNITATHGTVDFGLQFSGFDEIVPVTLP